MRAKIAVLLLSVALVAGAQGTPAVARGANVMWQNAQMTVRERLGPLTITYKNRIGSPVRFRCRFMMDHDWHTARGELAPWQRLVTLPQGTTASQFSCRTRIAG
jgi:hypothetical protein